MANPSRNIVGQSEDAKNERTRLKHDYLAMARDSWNSAKELLAQKNDQRLRYAALDLRQAFEALVYEHALGYTDELVGEDYLVWQPTQLLEKLIEIDPHADVSFELSIQDPATKEWHKLGKQARVTLKDLKKRYFALGKHLHAHSLADAIQNRGPKRGALRKLCNECVALIETDLNASMRSDGMSIFGNTSLNCMECGTPMRRRLNGLRSPQYDNPKAKPFIRANCAGCSASYKIAYEVDGFYWSAERRRAPCPFKDCDGEHVKWVREIKPGMVSKCPSCGRKSKLVNSLTFLPEAALKRG